MFGKLRQILGSALDLIFPPACPACGALSGGGGFCGKCAGDVAPAGDIGDWEYYRALGGDVFAAYEYGGAAREAVLNLKFRRRKDAAGPLASSLFRALPAEAVSASDFITCIPISQKRLSERGYNQAEELAARLAPKIGKPVLGALKRVKETPPFYKLSAQERADAIDGAFAAVDELYIKGKTVLLVDDIITTGATMAAAAKALKRAGAARVVCAAACAAKLDKADELVSVSEI